MHAIQFDSMSEDGFIFDNGFKQFEKNSKTKVKIL